MNFGEVLLVIVALAFAWSMGAHYTGACMGMPYATGSVRLWPALWTMAPLTLLGATFLSHRVLENVGHDMLVAGRLGTAPAIAVLAAAFLLTAVFTQRRIPTATIQILVFCLIGGGAALGLAIRWRTVVDLALLWVIAPFIAFALGYVFTKFFDAIPGLRRCELPKPTPRAPRRHGTCPMSEPICSKRSTAWKAAREPITGNRRATPVPGRAIVTLPPGSVNRIRVEKAIRLAAVGVTFHDFPPAHFTALAVNAVLLEGVGEKRGR